MAFARSGLYPSQTLYPGATQTANPQITWGTTRDATIAGAGLRTAAFTTAGERTAAIHEPARLHDAV